VVQRKHSQSETQPIASSLKRQRQQLLWNEYYSPTSEDELVISKMKVKSIKTWLADSFEKLQLSVEAPRLLVLSGPPGCGKTTALRVLAKELEFSILEWINPVHLNWKNSHEEILEYSIPRMREFREFLLTCGRYQDLTISNKQTSKKLLLIKDMPFLFGEAQRHQFTSIIQDFLSCTRFLATLIISNDQSSSIDHFLLADLLKSPLVSSVNFPPISVGAMRKALSRVLSKENLELDANTLTNFCDATSGDLRQAIHSLQFHFIIRKQDKRISTVNSSDFRKRKSGNLQSSKSISATEAVPVLRLHTQNESLFGLKDPCLTFFHAFGKIFYKKNDNVKSTDRIPSEFDADKLIKSASLDSSVVVDVLQENYLNFYTDIDDVSNVSGVFSDCCQLIAWEDFDSISLQISSIACRALMHFNTHDVPRRFQSIRKSRLISSYQMERENRRTFSSFYYGHLQPFSKGKDYIDIVHR